MLQIVLCAAAATWSSACDFEPTDISLDDTGGNDASQLLDRDAAAGASGSSNNGAAGQRPPRAGAAGSDDSAIVPEAGGGGSNSGTTAPPETMPDATTSMDSGMDASSPDGALSDATGPDTDPTDEDTGTDEDADVPDPDPCRNGTFQCVPGRFTVVADFTTTLANAVVYATCGEYRFEVVDRQGPVHELLLPIGCPMWVVSSAEGFWDSETPILLGPEVASYGPYDLRNFSTPLLNAFLAPLQQVIDEKKGVVVPMMQPIVEGTGMTIGQPSDAPSVNYGMGGVFGNTVRAGGSDLILYPNVEPGPLTLTPITPEGVFCIYLPVPYASRPMTTTFFPVYCGPAGP